MDDMEPLEQIYFRERSTKPDQGFGHGRRRVEAVGFSGSERSKLPDCSLARSLVVVCALFSCGRPLINKTIEYVVPGSCPVFLNIMKHSSVFLRRKKTPQHYIAG
jgi:hypothetical protein